MTEFVLKNNYFEFKSNVKVRNLPHHMRVHISTTRTISFSKMSKFSFGFGSSKLMIFFSFGQPVKKNLMIFWNDSTVFIPI